MADARSMLRQQRAARQQAQKPQKQSAAPAAVPSSKKRKANEDAAEGRKRTRTEEKAGVPAGFFDATATPEEAVIEPSNTLQESTPAPDLPTPETVTPSAPRLDPSTAAELDAFMNEMAQERPAPISYASGTVIEAKPMTAAEIAAQARQDQSAQRAKKDEEMEGEKEDAARALEDEFEEMEGLEERVKRLRAQREALRVKYQHPLVVEHTAAVIEDTREDEASESEDGEEDWDDWRFRPA
jgi:hypothetical protein